MRTAWWIVFGLLAGAVPARAADAGYRQAALASYELADLGGTVVVRATGAAAPHRSGDRYFVFFQFEGVLWCYAPEAGTWVIGPAPSRWPPTDRDVTAWVAAAGTASRPVRICRRLPGPANRAAELPNGCVVACLARLSNLLIHSGPPDEVGLVLLSYDGERGPDEVLGPRVIGHSLLVYRYAGKWYCFDPRWEDAVKPLGQVAVGAPLDATLEALAQRPDFRLAHARLLRISRHTLDQVDAGLTWRMVPQRPD